MTGYTPSLDRATQIAETIADELDVRMPQNRFDKSQHHMDVALDPRDQRASCLLRNVFAAVRFAEHGIDSYILRRTNGDVRQLNPHAELAIPTRGLLRAGLIVDSYINPSLPSILIRRFPFAPLISKTDQHWMDLGLGVDLQERGKSYRAQRPDVAFAAYQEANDMPVSQRVTFEAVREMIDALPPLEVNQIFDVLPPLEV